MSRFLNPSRFRFATGGPGGDNTGGRICIWNLSPVVSRAAETKGEAAVPRMFAQMDRHLGCVNCLRWSPSGAFLASGADDKLVMIWKRSAGGGVANFGSSKASVESWRCVHNLRGHDGDVLDLAWASDDRLLATASVDNTVIIWNGQSFPDQVTVLRSHTGLVKGVSFDPVGRYLATQSDDRSLKLWRTSDWKEEATVTEPFEECGGTTHVLRPDWSPDGNFLVSAHAMNEGGPTAQIIDRTTWKTGNDFVGHKKGIN